jgi:hypothetical protein
MASFVWMLLAEPSYKPNTLTAQSLAGEESKPEDFIEAITSRVAGGCAQAENPLRRAQTAARRSFSAGQGAASTLRGSTRAEGPIGCGPERRSPSAPRAAIAPLAGLTCWGPGSGDFFGLALPPRRSPELSVRFLVQGR